MDRKYLNIYNAIVNKIESKEYAAHQKLPSESALMAQYQVSRDTVRKALNRLSSNGYIQKNKGKGSFVLDIHKLNFPISGVVSFKEIAQNSSDKVDTFLAHFACTSPSPSIAKHLEIQPQDKVWEVLRTRAFNDEKVILDRDYLVCDIIPYLSAAICQDSLYQHIEQTLGLKIAYAKKEITVQNATQEDKDYLDMKAFDMVVVVRSYTYLDDNRLFQYTISKHRPDKFVFIDFARRH